jgi:glycosyltransferase involved in cell wall biosynthesis
MGLGDDSLSIVIPFYNEPENAHAILTIIANYRQSDIEWVLVNNGSTDQVTAAILESSEQIRYICLDANVGFGGGIKAGLQAASSDYVAWMPGNLKVHPLAAKLLLDRFNMEPARPAGLVLIKALRVGRGVVPQLKTTASSLLVSFFGRAKLTDIGGTPTLVSRECIPYLMDTPNDYSFELAAYYTLLGLDCHEVRIPSAYLPRIYGQTHWQFGLKPEIALLRAQIKFVLEQRKMKHTK